jgi:alpha-L-fucosidase
VEILSNASVMPVPSRRIVEFEKLGYGMFIHWGLYSLLGRGEWVMYLEGIPVSEYSKLASDFKADKFSGRQIARLAKQAGMKYICITTRHHDGFSLYDTKGLCGYDAVHSAAGRDLIKDFVAGCREEGIVPFFYHTLLDWYQQSYKSDFKSYLQYLRDSIEILCWNYGPVGGFWFDVMWDKSKADQDWEGKALFPHTQVSARNFDYQ